MLQLSMIAKTLKSLGKCVFAALILFLGLLLVLPVSAKSVVVEPDLPKLGTPPSDPQYDPIIKLAIKDDAFCSAFVIDANYALTAGHCIDNGFGGMLEDEIQIQLEDGTDSKITAKAVGINNRTDVGLIKGDFNKFQFLIVNFYTFPINVREGDYVTCGYPYGQKRLTCVRFVPVNNSYFAIAGKGFLMPGMSGGPMIDLNTGVVLGVNISVGEGLVNAASTIGSLGAFGIEPPPSK